MSNTFTVVGTGHRPKDIHHLGKAYSGAQHMALARIARTSLISLLGVHKHLTVVCGGAQGWDTALFHAAVVLRDQGQPIHVVLATPGNWSYHCMHWPIRAYNTWWLALHARANQHIQLAQNVTGSPGYLLNMRNHLMLAQITPGHGCVLAFHSGKAHGGTYNTITAAGKLGLPVVNAFA